MRKSIWLLIGWVGLSALVAAPCLTAQVIAGPSGHPVHDTPITRPLNRLIGEAGNDTGFDMAPETTIEVVRRAVDQIDIQMPKGPFKPEWSSIEEGYKVPDWFIGAKFGLFMHWGLYAVPAYKSEWYEKHVYGNADVAKWHEAHYGPLDKFGYKDFIGLFTQQHFDGDQWAELFKKSGAKFVIPTAQHHDNFALWDSKVTPYNAAQMGPKRDLIGELCAAVRRQGLKFGVSNHGIENFQFINPPAAVLKKMQAEKADLFDPAWKDFYHASDRSDAACEKFLVDWYKRNVELIDKYQPDMLWFDNGIDQRYLDPLKLLVAAYYYNRAKRWGKEVSISSKKAAFAPSGTNIKTIGSILDFEGRVPAGIRAGVWQVDSKIGSTWGYTTDMKVGGAGSIIATLVDVVSKNGTLLLNLSPTADGRIPQQQQETLLEIGDWLQLNGQAIYNTHNWVQYTDSAANAKVRFTVNADSLYVIVLGRSPAGKLVLPALALNKKLKGEIKKVSMLGGEKALNFMRTGQGLVVDLPLNAPSKYAYVLKIEGLKLPLPDSIRTGNPRL